MFAMEEYLALAMQVAQAEMLKARTLYYVSYMKTRLILSLLRMEASR